MTPLKAVAKEYYFSKPIPATPTKQIRSSTPFTTTRIILGIDHANEQIHFDACPTHSQWSAGVIYIRDGRQVLEQARKSALILGTKKLRVRVPTDQQYH